MTSVALDRGMEQREIWHFRGATGIQGPRKQVFVEENCLFQSI